jgi:hypothetical protein
MTNAPDIKDVADRLTAAMPRLDAPEQQIAITLVRQKPAGGFSAAAWVSLLGRVGDARSGCALIFVGGQSAA